ncbi:MAG: membrane associated rhomboid family serine protease [Candidatus Woesearchaeota archaeon]|jgi:membrane associated rhomboid family serine protease
MSRWTIRIAIITGIAFVLQQVIPGFTELFRLNGMDSWAMPWQLLTPIFMHGSISHILFNMLAFVLFGSILEQAIGSKRFLYFYLIVGILGNVVGSFIYPAALGASGAVMGIMGMVGVLRPRLVVYVYFIPMRMWAAVILWAIFDIMGTFSPNGVANAIHLVGLACGVAYGFFLLKKYGQTKPRKMDISRVMNDQEFAQWHKQNMR